MATEARPDDKHPALSQTPRESVWLSAGASLGWGFLMLHLLPLKEYMTCLALGPPWAHRRPFPSLAEAGFGLLVLGAMLTVPVVGALRWSGRRIGDRTVGLLWSSAVGAAGVAGGVAAFFLFLTPYPGAVDALALGLAWAGVGVIPARACLGMAATTRQQWIKRLSCALLSALPALGVGYYLLTHVVPIACVKYAYEGVSYLAPSLVGCVVGSYGIVAVAGTLSASRAMTPEREPRTTAD